VEPPQALIAQQCVPHSVLMLHAHRLDRLRCHCHPLQPRNSDPRDVETGTIAAPRIVAAPAAQHVRITAAAASPPSPSAIVAIYLMLRAAIVRPSDACLNVAGADDCAKVEHDTSGSGHCGSSGGEYPATGLLAHVTLESSCSHVVLLLECDSAKTTHAERFLANKRNSVHAGRGWWLSRRGRAGER